MRNKNYSFNMQLSFVPQIGSDPLVVVEDRAGHDRRYAIDATKIENELSWKADEDFESGIVKTIEWYLEKYNGENI